MATSSSLDSVPAFRGAVRTAILADATLSSTLVGSKVLVQAPSSHPTPYIQLTARSQDWATATEDGQEIFLDLHVWHQRLSQTPETDVARDIMSRLKQVLHTASLSLASPFTLTQMRVDSMIGPYLDPDGTTLHGVVSLHAFVDHG